MILFFFVFSCSVLFMLVLIFTFTLILANVLRRPMSHHFNCQLSHLYHIPPGVTPVTLPVMPVKRHFPNCHQARALHYPPQLFVVTPYAIIIFSTGL